MDSVHNSQTVQDLKNVITIYENLLDTYQASGPVGQTVTAEKQKTQNEFQDLADSKKTPEQPTATGQPLTHYHSFFYRLLSWKNPRATSIAYLTTVVFIFLARYLDILRYIFKGTYTVLGITAAAEVVGHLALGEGLTSKIRPKKYFVIQRDSMVRFLDDIEQLTNFFVIETQRIIFAENVYVTVAAFTSAFLSYWLIKWLPLWGLSLISVNVLFLAPLIYTQNQELIDGQLNNAGDILNKQTAQARDIASQYTSKAQQSVGAYTKQAHNQISGMIGQKNKPTASDYPQAPKQEPYPSAPTQAPGVAVTTEGQQPVAAALSVATDAVESTFRNVFGEPVAPTEQLTKEIMEPESDIAQEASRSYTNSINELLAEGSKDSEQDGSAHEDQNSQSTHVEPPSSHPSPLSIPGNKTHEAVTAIEAPLLDEAAEPHPGHE